MKYLVLIMTLIGLIAYLGGSQEPHNETKVYLDTMAYLTEISPHRSAACYAAATNTLMGNHQANVGLFPSTMVCATYVVKTASLEK